MVTFLSGFMPLRAAKLISYVLVPLLILWLFYLALDAYGDSRFREGRAAENAAWKQAQDKLLEDAVVAANKANTNAFTAAVEYNTKVEAEKEKVDDAIANGSSPLDVLFPSGGVQAR